MKIAIFGGTGDMGKGFTLRLTHKHKIFICSRNKIKAEKAINEYTDILKNCFIYHDQIEYKKYSDIDVDIVILTIPYTSVKNILDGLEEILANKIIVSPIVPMINRDGQYFYDIPLSYPSFSNAIQEILPKSKIVSAFQNIPASKLSNLSKIIDDDIIICGNDEESKKIIQKLYYDMFRCSGDSYDGGNLEDSNFVDAITPFLINLTVKNKTKPLSIKLR